LTNEGNKKAEANPRLDHYVFCKSSCPLLRLLAARQPSYDRAKSCVAQVRLSLSFPSSFNPGAATKLSAPLLLHATLLIGCSGSWGGFLCTQRLVFLFYVGLLLLQWELYQKFLKLISNKITGMNWPTRPNNRETAPTFGGCISSKLVHIISSSINAQHSLYNSLSILYNQPS
jgi:hypothetical protein